MQRGHQRKRRALGLHPGLFLLPVFPLLVSAGHSSSLMWGFSTLLNHCSSVTSSFFPATCRDNQSPTTPLHPSTPSVWQASFTEDPESNLSHLRNTTVHSLRWQGVFIKQKDCHLPLTPLADCCITGLREQVSFPKLLYQLFFSLISQNNGQNT